MLLTHISYLFLGCASFSFRWHRHIGGRAAGLLKASCVPEDWLTGGGFTSTSKLCLRNSNVEMIKGIRATYVGRCKGESRYDGVVKAYLHNARNIHSG